MNMHINAKVKLIPPTPTETANADLAHAIMAGEEACHQCGQRLTWDTTGAMYTTTKDGDAKAYALCETCYQKVGVETTVDMILARLGGV